MSPWKITLSALVGTGLLVGSLVLSAPAEEKKDDKPASIKQVMAKFHKGNPALCGKASKGQASEAELKEMLAGYEAMCAQKPPKGDEEAWKAKCVALIDATKALIEKKDGAAAAYGAAVSCKSCHDAHKGGGKAK